MHCIEAMSNITGFSRATARVARTIYGFHESRRGIVRATLAVALDNLLLFLAHSRLRKRRHLVMRVQGGLDDAHGKYCSGAFAESELEVEQGGQSHAFEHQPVSLFYRGMPGKQIVTDEGVQLDCDQGRRA